MKNWTDLRASIDDVIVDLAGVSDGDVRELEFIFERALTHVMVERHLRVRDTGVSHLRPVK